MTTKSQLFRTLSANFETMGFERVNRVGVTYALERRRNDAIQMIQISITGWTPHYVSAGVGLRFGKVQELLYPLLDLPELDGKRDSMRTLGAPLRKLSESLPKWWAFYEGDNGSDLAIEIIKAVSKYGLPYLDRLSSISELHEYLSRGDGLEFSYLTRSQGLSVLLATSYLLGDKEQFRAVVEELNAGGLGPSFYVEKLTRLAAALQARLGE